MKDFLKKLIERKKAELKKLEERNAAATTVDEVRAIGEQLLALRDEINDAEAQLKALEDDENDNDSGEGNNDNGAGEEGARSFNPMAAFNMTRQQVPAKTEEAPTSTMEYRQAFMNYVQRGTMADVLKRDDTHYAGNVKSDLGVLIPETIIQEIIKGVEKVYGQLYSRVKKTNVKGGVKYPIGSFSATFKRIVEYGEGAAPSERQYAGSVSGYVEFSYNIGEIRIAQTLLANVLSVPVFEKELANTIVEAYVKAMDHEIMTGVASNNQCEGILTEAAKENSRIPAANIIEFTAADMADWKKWQEKLFAKIPLSMRALSPEFVMTANTYEANIKTLADDNNRPVYNETFNPVDGSEIATFKGKQVCFVEEDILENFNDADNGEYFGMYWVPEKGYAVNTNLEFFVKRYFDDEKNEYVDKALVINDGKILDPKYIYLLKKKVEG